MSNVETLQWKPLPWRIRKCLRSKRMTRWFLGKRRFLLRPASGHQGIQPATQDIELLPQTILARRNPFVTVGDPEILLCARQEDNIHPPVKLSRLQSVCVSSLSNLIYSGKFAIHGNIVSLESDRLPEEYQAGVHVDVTQQTLTKIELPVHLHRLPEAVSLLDATATNYAHWLTEILPKAAIWSELVGRPLVPLLVDAGLHPNQMRALELVVPPEQSILLVPRSQIVEVSRLHYLSSPGHIPFEPRASDGFPRSHGTFSAGALSLLIGAVKRRLNLRDDDPQEGYLYVRRNSRVRNIINQVELDAFVAKQGWTVVAPEGLSFDDQVRLFHRAKMVFGATGAAMANLIFARPGCRVAVMMSAHPATPYFYWHNLADSLGVHVEYILCEPESGSPDGVHSNFMAPVAGIAKAYAHDRIALMM